MIVLGFPDAVGANDNDLPIIPADIFVFMKNEGFINPEGDAALNRQQAERLKRLSDYLHNANRSLFMFELLVPAEKTQLDKVGGDKKAYDAEIRPELMVEALESAAVRPSRATVE